MDKFTANTTRLALLTILLHAAVVAIHSLAHVELDIDPTPAQLAFIVTVIMVAPFMAGALLLRGGISAGAAILAASMAGSLLFGVYYHFILISPDHVAHLPAGGDPMWATVFRVSAYLMSLVEGLGILAGGVVLRAVVRPVV